jgi:hypothetical protein
MATTPSPTTLTRVARHKLDLFNKIHWKNQSSIQHYLLGANAKYTNLQVPVWRIGHASGVFVVTQAEEWFLMTKALQKLERDAKRSSISKYTLKKLRKAIPSHAGVPFGPPPPAAAIPPAAASPDNEGPIPPDQPSISMPPPSIQGPSARVVDELSTGKVLTTEWVNGERLDRSEKDDVTVLCSIVINTYLTMMLELGTLHR